MTVLFGVDVRRDRNCVEKRDKLFAFFGFDRGARRLQAGVTEYFSKSLYNSDPQLTQTSPLAAASDCTAPPGRTERRISGASLIATSNRSGAEIEENHREDVTDPELIRKRYLYLRLGGALVKEHQCAFAAVA